MRILLFALLLTVAVSASAQQVFSSNVDKTDIVLRGGPVVLAEVTVSANTAGKVVLRFDGDCISTPGDRIYLAASNTHSWGDNDNNVNVKAINTDLNSNVFSHTRVYEVKTGDHTFYAVAENYGEKTGSGIASIFGNLTAEFFPDAPGKAFVKHTDVVRTGFNVEGAPVVLAQQTLSIPTSGKVLARFDGYCISSSGDLLFIAVNNMPAWNSADGSSSIEIVNNDFNRNAFAHVRSFDVTPGERTFYAVIENYYETYGNGIASIFGCFTLEFFPEGSPVFTTLQGVNQVGIALDAGGPVKLSELTMNAPTPGKVQLNFSGTCIGSFGDYLKLAASNGLNWSGHGGSLGFEPFSSDRNRTSFSHTRVYDVPEGPNTFYAVGQNVLEFFGSGLAVVYGSLTATFYPDATLAAVAPEPVARLECTPNPVSGRLRIAVPEQVDGKINLTVHDLNGRQLQSLEIPVGQGFAELDATTLPPGVYMVRAVFATGFATGTFIRN